MVHAEGADVETKQGGPDTANLTDVSELLRKYLRLLNSNGMNRNLFVGAEEGDKKGEDTLEAEDGQTPVTKGNLHDSVHHDIRLRTGNSVKSKVVPNMHSCLRGREWGERGTSRSSRSVTRVLVGQRFLPDWMRTLHHYDSRVFCGQFSPQGDVFVVATQDRTLRFYHTHQAKGDWVFFREVYAQEVGWSILDVSYSPDSEFLVYSSWANKLQFCNIHSEYTTPSSSFPPLFFDSFCFARLFPTRSTSCSSLHRRASQIATTRKS